MCFPGILLLLNLNYLLLHTWMNAWAEMLRFADRLFYKANLNHTIDWWNSTSFPMWNRKWNVIVHDWLHTYLYKDMYEIVVPHKPLAIFTSCSSYLQFFTNTSSNISFNNILVWMMFCFANGILMSVYAMGYYSSYNCLSYSNYYANLLLPQSWNYQQQLAA
ncbi:Sterol O-acyltransferase 2 [Camponotus floridanus]|uniref:Sterol O-acyltransferase 2 n=1 Tax=Camponotus floridanus TaxID=104421 RepID=E2A0H3_CAMFO|nr:Sterol O-acyltransferase 2 [Camponotus floridanus]